MTLIQFKSCAVLDTKGDALMAGHDVVVGGQGEHLRAIMKGGKFFKSALR